MHILTFPIAQVSAHAIVQSETHLHLTKPYSNFVFEVLSYELQCAVRNTIRQQRRGGAGGKIYAKEQKQQRVILSDSEIWHCPSSH